MKDTELKTDISHRNAHFIQSKFPFWRSGCFFTHKQREKSLYDCFFRLFGVFCLFCFLSALLSFFALHIVPILGCMASPCHLLLSGHRYCWDHSGFIESLFPRYWIKNPMWCMGKTPQSLSWLWETNKLSSHPCLIIPCYEPQDDECFQGQYWFWSLDLALWDFWAHIWRGEVGWDVNDTPVFLYPAGLGISHGPRPVLERSWGSFQIRVKWVKNCFQADLELPTCFQYFIWIMFIHLIWAFLLCQIWSVSWYI